MLGVKLAHPRWWLGVWRVPCPWTWVANCSVSLISLLGRSRLEVFQSLPALSIALSPCPASFTYFQKLTGCCCLPGHFTLEGTFLSNEAEFWEAQLLSPLKWEQSHFTIKRNAHWLGAREGTADMWLCAPGITFFAIPPFFTIHEPSCGFSFHGFGPPYSIPSSTPPAFIFVQKWWRVCWGLGAGEMLGQTLVLTP